MQEVTKVGTHDQRRLTAVEFQNLARVPAAVEWFANLDTPALVVPIKMTWKIFVDSSVWPRRTSFA
jgi:hypothetical protein